MLVRIMEGLDPGIQREPYAPLITRLAAFGVLSETHPRIGI